MAERNSAKKAARKPAKKIQVFTPEERAAMREMVQERKAGAADGESTVLAKLAAMPARDRALGERIHAIVKVAAPGLTPKTWYGMPAYAKGGDIICFFQNAGKFKARYSTLGFSDKARLDDGRIWPTSYALTELTAAEEARIAALVKRAAGL